MQLLSKLLFGIQIQVVNSSSVRIETVRVEVGGEFFETNNIPPGGSYTWRFRPKHDGAFLVRGRFASGKSIAGQSLGYTTLNDSSDHQFIVQEDGDVIYKAKAE